MKKLILLIAIISTLSVNVSASHLMGGQITVAQVSGLDYQITMQLYRDVTGISINPTANFTVEDINGVYVTQTVTTGHNGMVPFYNSVEMYEYQALVTFPGAGQFRISWEDCCRNPAIQNMLSPGGESLYLMTEVTVYNGTNSSSVFLNPPTTLAQKNSLWQYNPLPFDADGDSLAWLMEIPLGATGGTVVGYTTPHADPSNPFTLNALTGEITWMPDSNGHWEASFRVEEYRAGVKIGEIRRDMQIIVVDDTSNYHRMAFNNGSWPLDGMGNYAMIVNPGTPISLSVTATDQDFDQMLLSVQGEPMVLATNPAQWLITNNTAGSVSGTFSWTPQQSQERIQPYIIAFRGSELHNQNIFTIDETMLLYVSQNISTNDLDNAVTDRNLFPNPSSGEWTLSFKLNKSSDVTIDISDIVGKKVATVSNGILPAGLNVIRNSNADLIPGYYFVNVKTNDGRVFSSPLIVE